MSIEYLDARRFADNSGYLTFGEISQKIGYNVIAFASRIAQGWSAEEIKLSKRDGLEFSKKATFDLKGKQYATAGAFCATANIDVKLLTELTSLVKTAEEYRYLVKTLSSGRSDYKDFIEEFKKSISSTKVKQQETNTAKVANETVRDEKPVKSVDRDTDLEMDSKVKEIRKSLLTEYSEICIYDNTGKRYNSLSEFLQTYGEGIDEEQFKRRILGGFSIEDAITDTISSTYMASEFDTGEYDFPDGINGVPFKEYCEKNGVSAQYILTKYRRNPTGMTVEELVQKAKEQGTLEACIRWFVTTIKEVQTL